MMMLQSFRQGLLQFDASDIAEIPIRGRDGDGLLDDYAAAPPARVTSGSISLVTDLMPTDYGLPDGLWTYGMQDPGTGYVIGVSNTRYGLGDFLAGLGDINGDEVPDIGIGAGEAGLYDFNHVFALFGGANAWSDLDGNSDGEIDLRLFENTPPPPGTAGYIFRSPLDDVLEERRIDNNFSAGDIDGDGVNDLLFGGRSYRQPPYSGSDHNGKAYVAFSGLNGLGLANLDGLSGPVDGHINLDVLGNDNPEDGFRLSGVDFPGSIYASGEPEKKFGETVSAIGDMNGDGLSEIIVSSPQTSSVYLYYGQSGLELADYYSEARVGGGQPTSGPDETNGRIVRIPDVELRNTDPDQKEVGYQFELGAAAMFPGTTVPKYSTDEIWDVGSAGNVNRSEDPADGPEIHDFFIMTEGVDHSYYPGRTTFLILGQDKYTDEFYQSFQPSRISTLLVEEHFEPDEDPVVYRILGTQENTLDEGWSPRYVTGGFDLNEDGEDDLAFYLPAFDNLRDDIDDQGAVVVLFGGRENLNEVDAADGIRDGTIFLDSIAFNRSLEEAQGLRIEGFKKNMMMSFSTLTGDSPSPQLASGDFNGDGIGDLVMGTPYLKFDGAAPDGSNLKLGGVFVVYGGKARYGNLDAEDGLLDGVLSLENIDPRSGRAFYGNEGFGQFVANAGDTNDDVYDEDPDDGIPPRPMEDILILSTKGQFAGKDKKSVTYLLFGEKSPDPLSTPTVPDSVITATDCSLDTHPFILDRFTLPDIAKSLRGDQTLYADEGGREEFVLGTSERKAPNADLIDHIFVVGKKDATLTTGMGDDVLLGGKGDSTINGGGGDDLIQGEFGLDRLTGGSGSDVFYIDGGQNKSTKTSIDIISDFNFGIYDPSLKNDGDVLILDVHRPIARTWSELLFVEDTRLDYLGFDVDCMQIAMIEENDDAKSLEIDTLEDLAFLAYVLNQDEDASTGAYRGEGYAESDGSDVVLDLGYQVVIFQDSWNTIRDAYRAVNGSNLEKLVDADPTPADATFSEGDFFV